MPKTPHILKGHKMAKKEEEKKVEESTGKFKSCRDIRWEKRQKAKKDKKKKDV